MADDGEDVLSRHDLCRRRDHMTQQRPPCNLVKDFWVARLQSRSFARGENEDGKFGCFGGGTLDRHHLTGYQENFRRGDVPSQ